MDPEIKQEFVAINNRFDGLVEFLEENMATKDDVQTTKNDLHVLRQDLQSFREETNANFRDVRSELSFIRRDLDEVKARLADFEKRMFNNETAAAKDIIDFRSRIEFLERKVKQLELRSPTAA